MFSTSLVSSSLTRSLFPPSSGSPQVTTRPPSVVRTETCLLLFQLTTVVGGCIEDTAVSRSPSTSPQKSTERDVSSSCALARTSLHRPPKTSAARVAITPRRSPGFRHTSPKRSRPLVATTLIRSARGGERLRSRGDAVRIPWVALCALAACLARLKSRNQSEMV